ncbi:MAG: hypothetical protein PHQ65_09680 [Bacteroidales bacterium]|jgi:hypothetical protein|nr:hypothetical protein [Bacteroidales bacterium]MDD3665520.1 hypothetical protein [Bacteroidales bacterium]
MTNSVKSLDLSLAEARIVYLATQKMADHLEKEMLRRQNSENFNRKEEIDKLRTLHELSNKLKKYLNEFLLEG